MTFGLTYAVEPEPLDTGGAIRFAADAAGIDSTFVVANGDVMTDLDVAALVDAHRTAGADATIHLIGVADPSAFGVVELVDARDGGGRIAQFVEKPAPGTEPSNLINAGTYVFEPSVLDLIAPGARVSIERDTFPRLVAAGTVYGLATDDYWIDAGVPDLYRAANLDLLGDGRLHDSCEAIAPDATVDPGATVMNTIVGSGAVIEAGTHGRRHRRAAGRVHRCPCTGRVVARDGPRRSRRDGDRSDHRRGRRRRRRRPRRVRHGAVDRVTRHPRGAPSLQP